MDVWIESFSKTEFEVCLRESRTFDGPHSNLYVVCHKKKKLTESLQPAKITISIRISTTTDFFRVLSSVRCIFYDHTRHTEVRI